MSVAAIVPHWNRRDLLESLLPNLRMQTRPFDEIIVVDNGSTDGSAALAETNGARVLRLQRNAGFAVAVNRGVEAAKTDWVAILNNDVALDPAWLDTLLSSAQSKGASFATGKLLSAADPSVIDGAFDEISRGACACRCGAGKPDSALWNKPRKIRFAPMTAALFRRDLFAEIGGLDETFGSYLEDVDFGIRCALAGREGTYEPSAFALHRGSATLGAWNSDTVRYISQNQILLAWKHFRRQPWWPVVVGQLLWGLLALRHGRGIAFIRGKLSGWRITRGCRPGDYVCTDTDRIGATIAASERVIFEVQQQTGFDWYWRIYFWLLPR